MIIYHFLDCPYDIYLIKQKDGKYHSFVDNGLKFKGKETDEKHIEGLFGYSFNFGTRVVIINEPATLLTYSEKVLRNYIKKNLT